MTISAPYVSAAAFQAHPTYLDLDDLRVGSSSLSDQVAELTNILLIASAWADNYCEQPLSAHMRTQRLRQRLNRYGQLIVHPDNTPVLSVTGISWGYTPSPLTAISDLSQVWIEDGRQIVALLAGASIPASAGLQFGGLTPAGELFLQLTYSAGWVAPALSATATAGATTLTVTDPTGILPGGQYRIWEPGSEETVTISSNWATPAPTVPPTPTSIPLASPTLFAHAIGHDFSGMPAEVRLAIINYAISQLMRPDTAAEDSYPDTHHASGTRQADSRQDGSGLVAEAEQILDPFRRVR